MPSKGIKKPLGKSKPRFSEMRAVQIEANGNYEPLSSVWEKSDGELIEAMLRFYATIEPEPILDATYNAGRFWKGSSRDVWSMDIDPKYQPKIVADNRVMDGVPASTFGTVVFDPPHVGPQGRDKSVKRFDVDFGATMKCGKEHGWSLSYLYPPFLKQAKRVLQPNGLLLAKITDMVNNHRSKWAHCDFMRMAEETGFTVCGFDHQSSYRPDDVEQVENGPPRQKTALLLDRLPQWGELRTVSRSSIEFYSRMPPMSRLYLAGMVGLWTFTGLRGAEGPVIDTMDQMTFRNPKVKGRAEQVEGKFGKAIRFTFDKDCQGIFFPSNLCGKPEWDQAAGFSFWVKGDGSEHCGGLEFIYDDDYSVRYDYQFPIQRTDWTKITVAWRDLIPVLPGPKSRLLDAEKGNKPSKLSALWVGRWWYWGDNPAHSFALDDMRLEKDIQQDTSDTRPSGAPLERVLAKLKAGKPITIVTMGDSLTDLHHWANREVSWPMLLQKHLEKAYHAKVTLKDPAIGGTQLRQNLVLMPRWLAQTPEPDLVTVCFGFNDWDAGMRGDAFREAYQDAVERIRRATKGKADVLILTTLPAVARWTTMAEMAESCRQAAQTTNAGLADTEKAFLTEGKDNKERLYAWDRTHLSPAGHALMAGTVLKAIDQAGQVGGR